MLDQSIPDVVSEEQQYNYNMYKLNQQVSQSQIDTY